MDLRQIDEKGFTMVEALFSLDQIRDWIRPLEEFRKAAGGRHSVRNLAPMPLVQEIASSPPVSSIVREILGDSMSLVRAILFDKVEGANWSVPWHQDLTIAVAERHEVEGYGPWSVKDGVVHVRPPASTPSHRIFLHLEFAGCSLDDPLRWHEASN